MTTLVLFLIIMLDHTRLCWHNLQKGHREIRNFKLVVPRLKVLKQSGLEYNVMSNCYKTIRSEYPYCAFHLLIFLIPYSGYNV